MLSPIGKRILYFFHEIHVNHKPNGFTWSPTTDGFGKKKLLGKCYEKLEPFFHGTLDYIVSYNFSYRSYQGFNGRDPSSPLFPFRRVEVNIGDH